MGGRTSTDSIPKELYRLIGKWLPGWVFQGTKHPSIPSMSFAQTRRWTLIWRRSGPEPIPLLRDQKLAVFRYSVFMSMFRTFRGGRTWRSPSFQSTSLVRSNNAHTREAREASCRSWCQPFNPPSSCCRALFPLQLSCRALLVTCVTKQVAGLYKEECCKKGNMKHETGLFLYILGGSHATCSSEGIPFHGLFL